MVNIRSLLLICLALALPGCSYNPFSTDNHLTGKPVGAAIGGTAGAGTAALAGASRSMVAVAGLGGAALGYYLTTIDFISGGIKQAGGDVLTQGDCITISLPTWRLFETGSTTFLPAAGPALDSTAQILTDFPDDDILISGNSSGYGMSKAEKRLTRRQASKIAGSLWAHGLSAFKQDGMTRRHLIIMGNGARFPIANTITAKGISENSRIQISACPSTADFGPGIENVRDANVGGFDEIPVPGKHSADNNPFNTDTLPAPADERQEAFQPPIEEGKPVESTPPDTKQEQPASSHLPYK